MFVLNVISRVTALKGTESTFSLVYRYRIRFIGSDQTRGCGTPTLNNAPVNMEPRSMSSVIAFLSLWAFADCPVSPTFLTLFSYLL